MTSASRFYRGPMRLGVVLIAGVLVAAVIIPTGVLAAGKTRSPSASPRASVRPHTSVPPSPITLSFTGNPITGITSTPAITPTFSPSIHDYVLYCAAGTNSVTFQVQQGGTSSSPTVNLVENQAVVLEDPAMSYWVRCLPHDMPRVHVRTANTSPTPGYYLTGTLAGVGTDGSAPYSIILDTNGTPVWYQAAPSSALALQVIGHDELAWEPGIGPGVGSDPGASFIDYNLETGTVKPIASPVVPTDPHDLLVLANGNRVLLGSPLRTGMDLSSLGPGFAADTTGAVVDCVVQEMDPVGNLLWQWRASDHVNVSESMVTPRLAVGPLSDNGVTAADVYHCNSIDVDQNPSPDPGSGHVLVSLRNASAVYDFNPTTGNVSWKLGGTSSTHDSSAHVLSMTDADGPFSGQHDARYGPSGKITLYDDHTAESTGAARGAQFAIDLSAFTGTMTWEYKTPTGHFSAATGSFRRDASGNVVGWGFASTAANFLSGFTEVDSNQPAKVLFDVTFDPIQAGKSPPVNYRAIKVAYSANPTLDINVLRQTAGALPPVLAWQSLGGVLTAAPAATSWSPARVDVFATGLDNGLWYRTYDFTTDTAFSGWQTTGGILIGAPAAASWGPNRDDVFVRGADNQLWHEWWDGIHPWSNWEPLGGVLTSAPAVASWGDGRLDIFARGGDSGLWHMYWDNSGTWSGWEPLGGQLMSEPSVTSPGVGRLDIFAQGTNAQAFHLTWNGSQWTGWTEMFGDIRGAPAITSPSAGVESVIAKGLDGTLERLDYNSTTGWGAWYPLGGSSQLAPAITRRDPARADEVFLVASDGSLTYTAVKS